MQPVTDSSRSQGRRGRVSGSSLLETPTFLQLPSSKPAHVVVVPQAGEATITEPFTSPAEVHSDRWLAGERVLSVGGQVVWVSKEVWERRTDPDGAKAAERRGRAEAEARRRAKAKMRRYIKANRCCYFWTLTYRGEGQHVLTDAKREVDRFLDALRAQFGPVPTIGAFELHPGGHGVHWHFVVDRFIDIALMNLLWPHGFTYVEGPGYGRTSAKNLDRIARYLTKYLTKDQDEAAAQVPDAAARAFYQHRYHRAAAFDPRVEKKDLPTAQEAYEWLVERYGRPERIIALHRVRDGIDGYWLCWPQSAWADPPASERVTDLWQRRLAEAS